MEKPSLVVNCGNPQITLNCQEENRNTITKCNEVTSQTLFGVQRFEGLRDAIIAICQGV